MTIHVFEMGERDSTNTHFDSGGGGGREGGDEREIRFLKKNLGIPEKTEKIHFWETTWEVIRELFSYFKNPKI